MQTTARIYLKKGKAKPFWLGEPIVFSGAIERVDGSPQAADLVALYDAEKKLIGMGFFNPHSLYRVRLILSSTEAVEPTIEKILMRRLVEAVKKRQTYNLPNTQTNAYRLCNSEGDFLSGLIVDVFSEYAVVYPTAYWVQHYQSLILELLKSLMNFKEIFWRPQTKALRQDGWKVENVASPENLTKPVLIQENGLNYHVDLTSGQKTGFYCDQRENRNLIRVYAKNRKVLDCFCYTGGFALNAKSAGAKKVLGIDSSKAAIELAKQNAELNHLHVDFETHKVMDVLSQISDQVNEWDFIILDPPKLAPSIKDFHRAKQHYLQLNQLALEKLPKTGLLFTCSCSDAMNKSTFIAMIKLAAKRANKKIRIIATQGAGADHPFIKGALYGDYLKGVLLEVS